jgi:hypothetical protein
MTNADRLVIIECLELRITDLENRLGTSHYKRDALMREYTQRDLADTCRALGSVLKELASN